MIFISEKNPNKKKPDYKHIKQHFENGHWPISKVLIVSELCILSSNLFLTRLWSFTNIILRILKALPLLWYIWKGNRPSTFTLWGETSPVPLGTVKYIFHSPIDGCSFLYPWCSLEFFLLEYRSLELCTDEFWLYMPGNKSVVLL